MFPAWQTLCCKVAAYVVGLLTCRGHCPPPPLNDSMCATLWTSHVRGRRGRGVLSGLASREVSVAVGARCPQRR